MTTFTHAIHADGAVKRLAHREDEPTIDGEAIIALAQPAASWPSPPTKGAQLMVSAAGALSWIDPRPIEQVRADKREQINAWRLAANQQGFLYAGKLISTDTLSRSDIDGTNGTVSLTGSFPEGWPGYWKSEDNSLIPINTVEEWKVFYAAMSAQGAANFQTSQNLKAQVAAATTIEEVESVGWPTPAV